MSCTLESGESCTRCCEVIGIVKLLYINEWKKYNKRSKLITDNDLLRSYLVPISKRRAKKINKHADSMFPDDATWFKCKKLKKGVGCTSYDKRPSMCSEYSGGDEYSPTCASDISRDKVFFKG